MTNLMYYFNDGANCRAQAVLCYLKGFGEIEDSYNKDLNSYEAEIELSRWENCREQGYVIMLNSEGHKKQLNIAFFEHRNSDNLGAIKWEQVTVNAPTIDTAKFGKNYKNTFDLSFEVKYDEAYKMAEWISTELNKFWTENKITKKAE